ncbi:hypothetical protein [Gimesia chilikensis]|nr:hypothetical protein [Gimesia chilikensis]
MSEMLLPFAVRTWLANDSPSQSDCDEVTKTILKRHLERGRANQVYKEYVKRTYYNDIVIAHLNYNPELIQQNGRELNRDNIVDPDIEIENEQENKNSHRENASVENVQLSTKQRTVYKALILTWCIFGRRATGLYQLYEAFYKGRGSKGAFCTDWCNMPQNNFTQWPNRINDLASEISALDDQSLIYIGEFLKKLKETPEPLSNLDSINFFNQDQLADNNSFGQLLTGELLRLASHIKKFGIEKTSDAYNEFLFLTQQQEDGFTRGTIDVDELRIQLLIEWYELLPADHPSMEHGVDLRLFISGILSGEYSHQTTTDLPGNEVPLTQAWSDTERHEFVNSLKANFPQHYKCYLYLAAWMNSPIKFLDCFPLFDQTIDYTELLNDEIFSRRREKVINRLEYWQKVTYRLNDKKAEPYLFYEWIPKLDCGLLTLEDIEVSLDAIDDTGVSEYPEVLKRAIYSVLLDELQRLMVTWFQFKRKKKKWKMVDVHEELRQKEIEFVRAN